MNRVVQTARVSVVGICGGSCSGKSSLVAALRDAIQAAPAQLCFDSYYRPLTHLRKAERDLQNFDHPDSLDHELFIEHLDNLRCEIAVDEPIYDFANHDRLGRTRRVEPARIVLVDGILLLCWPEIRRRLDLSIFIDADESTRLARRIERDVSERGRTEQSVRWQFADTVGPMHERFVQPSAAHADRVFDGVGDLEAMASELAHELATRLCR